MRLRIPLLGGTLALALALSPNSGQASSHREAPFIARMPQVDGTDFYMFNSYETARTGFVTILANYLPLQDAYGGPNYFSLDPDAIYEIHIDNDGDGVEDITFQFDFDSSLASGGAGISLMVGPPGNQKSVAIPVIVAAPAIDHDNESFRNQVDTYKLNIIRGPRRTGTAMAVTDASNGMASFKKPLDNAGEKTFIANPGGYKAYASSFIYNVDIPGCTPPSGTHARVFVGQRQEGFPVNLGQVFDLVNLNPVSTTGAPGTTANPAVAFLVGPTAAENPTQTPGGKSANITADKNVTTLALEIPASCLVASGKTNIGGWTTASIRQARVINPTPTFTDPSRVGGPWVQVSRLGMPLVNEVVIGLKDKNKFNSSEPKDDAPNFADYVTNPTLPEIVEVLFGATGGVAPDRFPRMDLVTAFALGVSGVNDTGSTIAEMVRLNTTTTGIFAPRARGAQSRLGAGTCFDLSTATADATLNPARAGCDPTGFPNGRRPGDDVVDIELRVAMGFLLNTTDAPLSHALLVDGATFGTLQNTATVVGGSMAANFDDTFPYLTTPLGGAP